MDTTNAQRRLYYCEWILLWSGVSSRRKCGGCFWSLVHVWLNIKCKLCARASTQETTVARVDMWPSFKLFTYNNWSVWCYRHPSLCLWLSLSHLLMIHCNKVRRILVSSDRRKEDCCCRMAKPTSRLTFLPIIEVVCVSKALLRSLSQLL